MEIRTCAACALTFEKGETVCNKCGNALITVNQEPADKESVKADFERLKEQAKSYSMADVKSGDWFVSFLRYALDTYTKKVTPEYFRAQYPNLPRDAIVDRRIALAKRYAMIEGGLSAGAYTAAVAATIGTAGGASPLAAPAAVASFVADLLYTTRLQLHLAYDISVLYGYPIDMEDPEDLYDLVRIAFGVKAGEALRSTAGKLAPEAVRQGVKAVITGSRLVWLKALPVVGKYLLQRNIIKFAIPAVGVPLSMGLNYWSTGSVATVARQVYRDKAAIREKSGDIAGATEENPLLALKAIWLVIWADKETSPEESWLLNDLTESMEKSQEGAGAVATFKDIVDLEPSEIYEELRRAGPEFRRAVYEAACVAAAADHKLQSEEKPVLKSLADACGVEFNEAALKKQAKEGLV